MTVLLGPAEMPLLCGDLPEAHLPQVRICLPRAPVREGSPSRSLHATVQGPGLSTRLDLEALVVPSLGPGPGGTGFGVARATAQLHTPSAGIEPGHTDSVGLWAE